MEKKKLLRCPYCGQKMGYFTTLMSLGEGEHTCKNCKKYYNLKYNNIVYLLLVICAFFSCILGFLLFKASIKGVILAIIPFVIFYFIIPLCIVTVPVKFRHVGENYENISSGREDVKSQEDDVKMYVPKKMNK